VRDAHTIRERDGLPDASPASAAAAIHAGIDAFPARLRLTREAALVDLQVNRGHDADVGGDAVARRKGDDVARDELVREDVDRLLLSQDVTVVGNKLVERLQALFGPLLLHKADCVS
jgi:hypothetical protein